MLLDRPRSFEAPFPPQCTLSAVMETRQVIEKVWMPSINQHFGDKTCFVFARSLCSLDYNVLMPSEDLKWSDARSCRTHDFIALPKLDFWLTPLGKLRLVACHATDFTVIENKRGPPSNAKFVKLTHGDILQFLHSRTSRQSSARPWEFPERNVCKQSNYGFAHNKRKITQRHNSPLK